MQTTFKFPRFSHEGESVVWRLATPEEIAEVRESGQHVTLACTECGHGPWSCKGLAISDRGGYNGARNIFYNGEGRECSCPSSALRMVTPEN